MSFCVFVFSYILLYISYIFTYLKQCGCVCYFAVSFSLFRGYIVYIYQIYSAENLMQIERVKFKFCKHVDILTKNVTYTFMRCMQYRKHNLILFWHFKMQYRLRWPHLYMLHYPYLFYTLPKFCNKTLYHPRGCHFLAGQFIDRET